MKNDYVSKCQELKKGNKILTDKKKDEIDPQINLKLVINCTFKKLGDNHKLPKPTSKQSHRTVKWPDNSHDAT